MTVRIVLIQSRSDSSSFTTNESSESLSFRYLLLCFRSCTLSSEMPSSSAAHFSAILCYSLLLMQLQGWWEYGDETKRAFQISALKIKGTKEKVTIDSQTKACSFALHRLLFSPLNVWPREY